MPNATIAEPDESPKANMDAIYVQPDPRAYFRELASLNYVIPDHAKPVFRRVIAARRAQQAEQALTLVDLGCSYGVNAALLKYDLDMATLYDRWSDPTLDGMSADAVIANDQRFFGALGNDAGLEIIGIDQSQPAIAYAGAAHLLDDGIVDNLEEHALDGEQAERLSDADLVLSTGCIGYIGEATFDHLLPAVEQGRRPWFANFVLRMFPFDAISDLLAERGYVTEKLEGQTFVQRDFLSEEEQARVADELAALERDPSGMEANGQYHAEFFLSRPEEDARAAPMETLLAA
ncbi:class I SAM-dependent methyltransferase [Stakelama sediminis]|uniref:Class I SAM-dependent methyltransferase n=1 Tax=Stakelama sediminis TaxID=463200 RepID=A0A840YWF3_9SPHN|nr:class I SAM-dependent methyltransferase [Stakelama sediminis]MBB5717879.1 hypothetical protein [Stakelama sediminis]